MKRYNFEEINSMVELMTMAIDDMEVLIDNPLYDFNADFWHEPVDGICYICVAGSVMANRLGAKISMSRCVANFNVSIHKKLNAIDNLRVGDIKGALRNIGNLNIYCGIEMEVPYYDFHNRRTARKFIKFWRDEGLETLRGIEEEMT